MLMLADLSSFLGTVWFIILACLVSFIAGGIFGPMILNLLKSKADR